MLLVVSLESRLYRVQFLDGLLGGAGCQEVFGAHFEAGGKGIVAARTLRDLNAKLGLVGIKGGITGQILADCLERERVPARFVDSPVPTPMGCRIYSPKGGGGLIQEYREEAAWIGGTELRLLPQELARFQPGLRGVLLCGSSPGRGSDFLLAELCQRLRADGVPALMLDPGRGLIETLEQPADWVLMGDADFSEAARFSELSELSLLEELFSSGCRLVVLGRGPESVRLITGEGELRLRPPETRDKGGLAPREAMAAMMLLRLSQGWDLQPSVAYGIAAGTAQTQKSLGGRLRMAEIEGFYRQIRASRDSPSPL
ncbi:MAG: PfkB family carbohydrate kinase [Planctomycetota bacterium]